ncbi:MAG: NB-ARC domain-containing protein [Agriterribacter sp.]
MPKQLIKVFISYAHDDEPYFKVFKKVLTTQLKVRQQFEYDVWDDAQIMIGSLWDDSIQEKLTTCDMAILCISDGFLASDYIKAKEFGLLIHKFPQTLLAPFLLSPCEFTAWDELAARQLFKPRGDRYGEAPNEDFTFADLVRFNQKDGNLIANVNLDRYVKDFITKTEEAITNRKPAAPKPSAVAPQSDRYLNAADYPYFEKDSFFGRDQLLDQLHKKINEVDIPLLLSGIGGMGKTAVAVAYGKKEAYSNAYDHIAWVNVTENIFSNLFNSFQRNPAVPFEYSADDDREKDIAFLMQCLKQVSGKNLLLIDNANDEQDIKNFITAWKKYQPGWKCLVTTRCNNYNYKNNLLELQVMSIEAATELFKRYNDEAFDEGSFAAIYNYIGGHTFLIELLAKFGQESNIINSTAAILSNLKAQGLKSLNKVVIAKQTQQQETDKQVTEFVMGLYDPLMLNETEQQFMRYFSVLPVAEISFDYLCEFFGFYEEDKDGFDNGLNGLSKKGWLMRNGNNFKCHQIIQGICREKLGANGENCNILVSSMNIFFEDADTTKASSFFELGLSLIHNLDASTFSIGLLELNLADRIVESGNFSDAMMLLQKSKDIFLTLGSDRNASICIERMGTINRAIGKTEEALNCYKEYYEVSKSLAENNPENVEYKNGLGISYEKLGDIYREQGKTKEALDCYKAYHQICQSLSEENPQNITYRNNFAIANERLGSIYKTEGKTEEALNCYKEYHEISKFLSDSNPQNISYRNNFGIANERLGGFYRAEGRMEEALACYTTYHQIRKALSESNPQNVEYKNGLAISYEKLGDIYKEQGKMEEALTCYNEDFKITKWLSENNPDNIDYKNGLAIAYERLGDVYKEGGKMEEALRCYNEDFKITKSLSESNPENVEYKNGLAIAYIRLGDVYKDQGKMGDVIKSYKEYHHLSKTLSENNPQNVRFKNNFAIANERLGTIYKEDGKIDDALSCYKEYYQISKLLSESSPNNIEYKNNLAISNERLGSLYKAQGVIDRSAYILYNLSPAQKISFGK